MLIVAQRVSTILHADRIIVMEGGTVAGIGTHDELMKSLRDVSRDRVLAALRKRRSPR